MAEEEPQSPILISEIHLQNLLSFGPDAKPIPLGPLNVLIGANGSGKSNFIEAIGLLRATPTTSLRDLIAKSGGVDEWIWKGNIPIESNKEEWAFREKVSFVRCSFPQTDGDVLIHWFGIGQTGNHWEIRLEMIELASGYQNFKFT